MVKYIFRIFLIFIFFTLGNFISSAQSFKFIAMTDSRGSDNGVNSFVLSKFVQHINSVNNDVKFIVFPGDLVLGNKHFSDSTYKMLLYWKEVMKPLYSNFNLISPKIFVTVGNHEIQNRFDETNFIRAFPDMPNNGPDDEKGLTYSFDYEKIHFVILNTNRWDYGDPKDTSDDKRDWRYIKHLDWLENDFINAIQNGAKQILVFGHEPIFPVGGHLRDCLPNLGKDLKLPLDSKRLFYFNNRNKFLNLLEKYNVSAYFCGHEHLYARQTVNGVMQIISGSSGAPLYNFNPKYGQDSTDREMSYEDAIPYYKILNYDYSETGNCQASPDFFGLKAFTYVLFEANENGIKATVFGVFQKVECETCIDGEISKLDEFFLKR